MKLRKNAVRRVLRGGSSVNRDARFWHMTYRYWYGPEFRFWDYGFRFVIRGTK